MVKQYNFDDVLIRDLRTNQGLQIKEIAKIIGIPYDSLNSYIYKNQIIGGTRLCKEPGCETQIYPHNKSGLCKKHLTLVCPSNSKEHKRNWQLETIFGITLVEYNQLLEKQNNVCAICGQPEIIIHKQANRVKDLAVDHDHVTGHVRGLLCQGCNIMLGLCDDNIEVLHNAILYLQNNQRKV